MRLYIGQINPICHKFERKKMPLANLSSLSKLLLQILFWKVSMKIPLKKTYAIAQGSIHKGCPGFFLRFWRYVLSSINLSDIPFHTYLPRNQTLFMNVPQGDKGTTFKYSFWTCTLRRSRIKSYILHSVWNSL